MTSQLIGLIARLIDEHRVQRCTDDREHRECDGGGPAVVDQEHCSQRQSDGNDRPPFPVSDPPHSTLLSSRGTGPSGLILAESTTGYRGAQRLRVGRLALHSPAVLGTASDIRARDAINERFCQHLLQEPADPSTSRLVVPKTYAQASSAQTAISTALTHKQRPPGHRP